MGVAFHQRVFIGMAELGADGVAVFLFLIGVVQQYAEHGGENKDGNNQNGVGAH